MGIIVDVFQVVGIWPSSAHICKSFNKDLTKLVNTIAQTVHTDGIRTSNLPYVHPLKNGCDTFLTFCNIILWYKRTSKHGNIFRELRPFEAKEKLVESVRQIRIIHPICTDGLFSLICT